MEASTSSSSLPYTKENLQEAVRSVLNGDLSVSQAVQKVCYNSKENNSRPRKVSTI